MIIAIAAAFGAAIAAVLGVAATRPDTFRVQRTATIAAPPDAIFPLIADFREWAQWSPFEKRDPEMKRAFSGAPRGLGAVYAWDGRKAGAGKMEIVEAVPGSRVTIRMDFVKPFRARNTAEFTLQRRDGTTQITWAMHGPSPFISRVMGVVLNMDRLIGNDFAAGLENLKSLTERRPTPVPVG